MYFSWMFHRNHILSFLSLRILASLLTACSPANFSFSIFHISLPSHLTFFFSLLFFNFFYYRYPANPSGLGFSLPIRFQTGSTLLKLAAKCKEIIPEIDFPFIVFHDPKDRVVLFPGKCVRKLLKES